MSDAQEKSANEIEALVLKAARGGGLPLGLAEDLAMAAAYLDLDKLTACPCSNGGAAFAIPQALDAVTASNGPVTVEADAALIAAYATRAEVHYGKTLVWDATSNGATFHRFEERATADHAPLGRRIIPPDLSTHLHDLAVKTHVPETESSRAGGAGAGLTDND
ncbi:Protein of unknown function [Octadecabacter temperatus]|uniref:Uncharacterized protein n=1 Tax=Octadecabacter temperatus TaxID=1458307 RepID=A0A0K0Y7H4_9RHOB|nr:DUF3726 domain-containing protein [Octadecabacter temperatus]AKS46924.1 hypothetical protein OSB_23880 [Octadecabacter temperatus]SIO23730.1 Protein of unknown function [Octadecabacter temperatus]